MMRLAVFPNIKVKLGGLGMKVCGSKFNLNPKPPSSDQLSELWKSWFFETIDLFGIDRCMFESNFPVDKVCLSYRTLWNCYKRVAAKMGLNDAEKAAVFHDTAAAVYKLEMAAL